MNCDICFLRHLTSSAVKWCPECDEKLCDDCQEHHYVSRSTRDHKTINISDYKQLPSFVLDIKYYCQNHDEKYLHFCNSHNKALCKRCILDEHKTCNDVLILDEVTKNAKSSVELDQLILALDNMKENIIQIQDDRLSNLSRLLQEKTTLKDEIKNVRQQINDKLDDIEKKVLSKLTSVYEKEEIKTNTLLKQLKEKDVQVKEMKTNIEIMQQYASNFQTFIATKEIANCVAATRTFLRLLYENGSLTSSQAKIKLPVDMAAVKTQLERLGDILVALKSPVIQYLDAEKSQAQIISGETRGFLQREETNSNLLSARPKSSMERSFKGKTLTLRTNMLTNSIKKVTASCFLPGKRLLISGNNMLETFDSNGTYVCGFSLDKEVYAITCIDPGTLGVSSGKGCSFSIVDLDKMKIRKTMTTSAPCLGISALDERLVYSISNKGVCDYNLESLKRTVVYKMENLSFGSNIAALDDKVYLTNPDTDSLIAFDSSFKLLWTFQNGGLLSSPTSVTIDDDGVVYIVGQKTKNVVAIKPDGSNCTEILGKNKELENPSSICVYEHSMFLAGDDNIACMFELS